MTMMERDRRGPTQGILDEGLTIALALLVDRIRRLSTADRRDLSELVNVLVRADSDEERESAVLAIREILEQKPIRVRTMDLPADEPKPSPGLSKWTKFVSQRIRRYRSQAKMTQQQLAAKSGLPQSHISRLESGKHSPSRATLEKIAKALGRDIGAFDPST